MPLSSWLAPLCVLGAFTLIYAPVVQWLLAIWSTDEYYGHGPVLWFISAFLIWREQTTLRALWRKHQAQPGNLALRSVLIRLFWLFGGLGLYLAGCLADINTVQALSLPIVLLGLAHFYGGSRFAGRLTFPLLFLWGRSR